MARGLYEMRNETQYKLQDLINHAINHQMIEISRWHAYYVVRDKKLIPIDEYSFKKLKDFTTEDWRRMYTQDWVECKELKIDYFG
jgi:hypothetical protein